MTVDELKLIYNCLFEINTKEFKEARQIIERELKLKQIESEYKS